MRQVGPLEARHVKKSNRFCAESRLKKNRWDFPVCVEIEVKETALNGGTGSDAFGQQS